jgi:hypothetical protein
MEECPLLLVVKEVPGPEFLDSEVFGIEVGIEVAGIGIADIGIADIGIADIGIAGIAGIGIAGTGIAPEGVNKEVAEKEVPNGSTEVVESLETAGVEGWLVGW